MKTFGIILLGLLAISFMSIPVIADNGQLRDPTRCGTGPANCQRLPPAASDSLRNQPRKSDDSRHKPSRKMQTSPLPSKYIQRNLNAPSSTGLDKGSTGLTQYPRK